MGYTSVTVTLDGRILIRQTGWKCVELTSPAEAQQVLDALTEAVSLSRKINPEEPA